MWVFKEYLRVANKRKEIKNNPHMLRAVFQNDKKKQPTRERSAVSTRVRT